MSGSYENTLSSKSTKDFIDAMYQLGLKHEAERNAHRTTAKKESLQVTRV